jgi:hypothetical protein
MVFDLRGRGNLRHPNHCRRPENDYGRQTHPRAAEHLNTRLTRNMICVRFDIFVPINYFLEGPRGVNFHITKGCLKGTKKLRRPRFSIIRERKILDL